MAKRISVGFLTLSGDYFYSAYEPEWNTFEAQKIIEV